MHQPRLSNKGWCHRQIQAPGNPQACHAGVSIPCARALAREYELQRDRLLVAEGGWTTLHVRRVLL
eukprot:SAG25_NODE_6_length_29267_cov_21.188803_17_plen_66_part_00